MFEANRYHIHTLRRGALTCLAALAVSAAAPTLAGTQQPGPDPDAEQAWRFRVLLGDREIGYHSFRVEQVGELQRVEIEASFDVRFLFFNAYRYRHSNVEIWRDGCLQRIISVTDDNGAPYRVTGESRADAFVYETGDQQEWTAAACTRTFAYWNPDFLQAERLLNAQTGEIVATRLQRVSDDSLNIGGSEFSAERYELLMDEGAITLWYSSNDGRWLALEAPAPGGRTLRYEPIDLPGESSAPGRLALN